MRRRFVFTSVAAVWVILLINSGAPPAAQEAPKPGTIVTVAGTGKMGYSGDGRLATEAAMRGSGQLAADRAGNLYFADIFNYCVRRISPDGVISTVVGTGKQGSSGDNGPAANATLLLPVAVATDAENNLFIADVGAELIRRVDTNGTITTVAGGGKKAALDAEGGLATDAKLIRPVSVAVDTQGNIYFAERKDHRVRKVSHVGTITTVAGTGVQGFSGDGGRATEARLSLPYALALDGKGNLFIGDWGNSRVRMVNADGIISTIAGGGMPADGLGDGDLATNAGLKGLPGLVVDAGGNLFIADNLNRRVRKVGTNDLITTVAGDGNRGLSGDGGPATEASFNSPWGLAVDRDGNLFIGDSGSFSKDGEFFTLGNNRIRKVYGVAVPN